MAGEVVDLLRPGPRKRYVDCTLGGGGHSERILELSSPDGTVLGLDWDEEASTAAQERLKRFGERLVVRRANFREAKMALAEIGWGPVDGVLVDLGLSSHHVDSAERGFSFNLEGRLDMRMDRRQALDAGEIVNGYPVFELARILRDYGEEPRARRIAAAIEAERRRKKIATTKELADLVARAVGYRPGRTHPATRTFQALRIAVNQELENLNGFLQDAYELLAPQGRMVAISFHSLEDRLVKRAFRKWSQSCLCPPRTPVCRCGWSRKVKTLTSRPLTASDAELEQNPRARSAKLRAVERL
jgi:16S rRNA (cytosine1402-N4)-methyltransferase